jgi:hypothetical protein
MPIKTIVLVVVVLTLQACGGKKSTDPGGISGSGCFAIVGNHGTITATISGLPAFSGIVPNANATFTPPAGGFPGIFVVQAMDTRTGTSVLVGGPMVVGVTTASTSGNGTSVQILVTTRSCTAATGAWTANLALGTATVTVTSASAAGVAGSFTGTLEPGTGATGNKTISGSFSATF